MIGHANQDLAFSVPYISVLKCTRLDLEVVSHHADQGIIDYDISLLTAGSRVHAYWSALKSIPRNSTIAVGTFDIDSTQVIQVWAVLHLVPQDDGTYRYHLGSTFLNTLR